jgi:hypothetical protein
MLKSRFLAVILLTACSASASSGQSAEDTVAYMLLSLDDGAALDWKPDSLKWSRSKDGSYRVNGKADGGDFDARAEISKISNCPARLQHSTN